MNSSKKPLNVFTFSVRKAVTVAASATLCLTANAEMTKDATLETLFENNRSAEVEKLARDRIGKNAKDEQAYHYLALAALAQNDTKKRTDALELLEACIAQLPQSSTCHLQAGRLLGVNAMEAGIMKAMGSVGRIKVWFTKALELEPKSFEARHDLIQFYLQAPGIAGGSVAKARELAQAATAFSGEQAKLLKAMIATYEKKRDEAEALLQGVKLRVDDPLAEALDDAWIGLGFSHINDKAAAKAKTIFERMVKDNPQRANAYFFLGRAQIELADWDAAIGSLKTAARLDKSGTYATDYRLGIAYVGKGEKAQAKASFERALKWPKLPAQLRETVQKRIAEVS